MWVIFWPEKVLGCWNVITSILFVHLWSYIFFIWCGENILTPFSAEKKYAQMQWVCKFLLRKFKRIGYAKTNRQTQKQGLKRALCSLLLPLARILSWSCLGFKSAVIFWVHTCISFAVWVRGCFLGVIYYLWCLQWFYFRLSLKGKRSIKTLYLGLSAPRSLSAHLFSCGLITLYLKKKLSSLNKKLFVTDTY